MNKKLSVKQLDQILSSSKTEYTANVKAANFLADLCKKYNAHDNGKSREVLRLYLSKYKLDTSHWYNRPSKYTNVEKICPVCETKFTTQLNHKNEKTVCSVGCANTYFPRHTEESRKKISDALLHNAAVLGRKAEHVILCKECGNPKITKRKHQAFCSVICSKSYRERDPVYRQKLRDIQLKRIKDGTHTGWRSRNKPSYPETFFMKVLDNNKIPYEFEKPVGKYFIDFAINDKQIALEIDGKQHLLPDRVIKDKEKDKYLTEQGWLMHRIPWTNISCDKGKVYIRNEINKFVALYNNSSNKFNMTTNTTITELTKQELVALMSEVKEQVQSLSGKLDKNVAITESMEQQLKQIFNSNRREAAPAHLMELLKASDTLKPKLAVDQKTGIGMTKPYFVQLISKDGRLVLGASHGKHGIEAKFFEGREGAEEYYAGLPNKNWIKHAVEKLGFTKSFVKLSNKQQLKYPTKIVNKK